MALLTRDFYERNPVQVARELIGKHLVRRTSQGLCSGVIVETEAYLAADDPASHSYRGVTRKNATMFGRAGLLYVFPIHGRHCLNAVTESRGVASAVLIRAVQPLLGIELMQQRRQCLPIAATDDQRRRRAGTHAHRPPSDGPHRLAALSGAGRIPQCPSPDARPFCRRPPAVTRPLDDFVHDLFDSGLLSDSELRALLNPIPDDRRPNDGEQLAREFGRNKKLTKFQAEQLCTALGPEDERHQIPRRPNPHPSRRLTHSLIHNF